MEIIKTDITVIKLEAPEGMYLTRVALADGEEPTFTKTAYLAQGDSPDNWRLATQEERKKYLAAQKELMPNETKQENPAESEASEPQSEASGF